MTGPNPHPSTNSRVTSGDVLATKDPRDVAAISDGFATLAPMAALSVICDSFRLLSAFAWSKEGRLSKNTSAKLCDLMNDWN